MQNPAKKKLRFWNYLEDIIIYSIIDKFEKHVNIKNLLRLIKKAKIIVSKNIEIIRWNLNK